MKAKKKPPLWAVLFGALVAVTVLLCAAAAALFLTGQQEPQPPVLPPTVEIPEEPEAPEEPQKPEEPDYSLEYNGKYYRYNSSIRNILLLGIDADKKPAEPLPYGSDIQADVIVLAALDRERNRLTLISLNRDTMCDFQRLDEDGFTHAQLALSFAYGDGLKESCQLTADAVSGIFHGLQIHGYGAFYLGGVAELCEAVGGVTVTMPEEPGFLDRTGFTAGEQVTLTGEQAREFISWRERTTEGNLLRMQRQKQFMQQALEQAMAQARQDPLSVLTMYQAVEPHVVTDLNLARLSYLAGAAAGMDFSAGIRTPEATAVLGEQNHMEVTLDPQALYELILEVFYLEVPV